MVRRCSRIVVALLFFLPTIECLINGHICTKEVNYTVTTRERYMEPVIVHTFTWCLQIPPRCPKTRTEMTQRFRVKNEVKTKIVEECCEGYEKQNSYEGAKEVQLQCLPKCSNCRGGLCIAPEKCFCEPGYRGDDCVAQCPVGFWGPQCTEECTCNQWEICDPVDGSCRCPPGLRGFECNESCPIGWWGSGCTSKCLCENTCDYITGECYYNVTTATGNGTESELQDTIGFVSEFPIFIGNDSIDAGNRFEDTSSPALSDVTSFLEPSTHGTVATDEGLDESSVEGWNSAAGTPKVPESNDTSDYVDEKVTTTRTKEEPIAQSTTGRPFVVLVSIPERRRGIVEKNTSTVKFSLKDAFLKNVEPSVSQRGSLNPDYVKTVRKEDTLAASQMPLDVAILIIVGSIVSLGLTSVAVAMIIHMRSRLFETIRLSIYDNEKSKSQTRESGNADGSISTIVGNNNNAPLPQTPINPVFTVNPEPRAILMLENLDSLNTYANGAAAIGIRLSTNLRDLLQQDHYDRPPSTAIRLPTTFDVENEHVYDEIPLQSSPMEARSDKLV